MINNIILVLSQNNDISMTEIELFEGRNRYTLKGLFSGPLKKKIVNANTKNEIVSLLLNLPDVAHIEKNKFVVGTSGFQKLINYVESNEIDSLYVKLKDGKLHHVSSIRYELKKKNGTYDYDAGSLQLTVYKESKCEESETTVLGNPIPILYLKYEAVDVRIFLCFRYDYTEIPADSKHKIFSVGYVKLLRNLQREYDYINILLGLRVKNSYRNEYTIPMDFVDSTFIRKLQDAGFIMFVKDNNSSKEIKKYNLKASISYDMGWFEFDGSVKINDKKYTLSSILSRDKHSRYVQVGENIIYLPNTLQNLNDKITDGKIKFSALELMTVNNLAEELGIEQNEYINKFQGYKFVNINDVDNVNAVLKKYQLYGVSWIYSHYIQMLGCCLADDMGLGKTLQSIAFLAYIYREMQGTALIIVPKIVLWNWKKEFDKFAPSLKVKIVYGSNKLVVSGKGIFITTYDTVVNNIEMFVHIEYEALILDESQYLKNYHTRRYNVISSLRRKFNLALSGTPIENNLLELWSLMNLLNKGILGNRSRFASDYITKKKSLTTLKNTVLPFILRRTKEAVLKDLPPKTEKYIRCDMDVAQRELYSRIMRLAKNEIDSKGSRFKIKDNAAILQALLYLREACSDPQLLPLTLRQLVPCNSCKYELFKLYVPSIIREHKKLVVFSQFPRTLKTLKKWCESKKWNTSYLDGSTTNRENVISEFDRADSGIFFISLKAGGVGLNLVSAQFVIIYEPWWNVAAENQATNRIYRIGQEKPVFIYHFLVNDTIEDKIVELQNKKKDIYNQLIESDKIYDESMINAVIELLKGGNV